MHGLHPFLRGPHNEKEKDQGERAKGLKANLESPCFTLKVLPGWRGTYIKQIGKTDVRQHELK